MTEVTLSQKGPYLFECKNSLGKAALIDGPAKIGGSDNGLRPMEMLLFGIGGCSVFDIIGILKKQRQNIENIDIKVQAERADRVPSIYEKIHLIFEVTGEVNQNKLDKAISLSMEKYCSVSEMLGKSAEITWEGKIISP